MLNVKFVHTFGCANILFKFKLLFMLNSCIHTNTSNPILSRFNLCFGIDWKHATRFPESLHVGPATHTQNTPR